MTNKDTFHDYIQRKEIRTLMKELMDKDHNQLIDWIQVLAIDNYPANKKLLWEVLVFGMIYVLCYTGGDLRKKLFKMVFR